MVWKPILANAGPSLITVEPPEDTNSVLHNPDSDPNELKFAKLADKTQHISYTSEIAGQR